MGFIRHTLLVFVSVVLFIAFLTGSLFLTFSLSLDYEHVKPELRKVVLDLANTEAELDSAVNERLEFMTTYCGNESEYVFFLGGSTYVIDCDVVPNGISSIIESGLDNFIDKIYYDDYSNCGFWKCIQNENPFVLFSMQAQDYWTGKFYLMLTIAIVLLVIMFLLVERKPNMLILSGALLTGSSLLFRKVGSLLGFIDDSVLDFVTIFFSRGTAVFLITIIVGIMAIGLGILWKILRWGEGKKKFSKKDVEDIVEKKVKESKEIDEKIKESKKEKKKK